MSSRARVAGASSGAGPGETVGYDGAVSSERLSGLSNTTVHEGPSPREAGLAERATQRDLREFRSLQRRVRTKSRLAPGGALGAPQPGGRAGARGWRDTTRRVARRAS